MVQSVGCDVRRQERSKNSAMNLKLFAFKFRAVWVAKAVNCPGGKAKMHGKFVTNNGGRSMTKSSGNAAHLKLFGCAHVNRKDRG